MRTRSGRFIFRPAMLATALAGLAVLLSTVGIAAAAVTMHGTYTTPNRQGTISYTAQRAIPHGTEGVFRVDGKSYPGSAYSATGGGTGVVWYYGTSGIMAGNGVVQQQPDGTYSGPLSFFARSGAVTDSGTLTVTFP